MSNEEISVANVILIVCISIMAVGAIWAIAGTVGSYIPSEWWLLIVGFVGFLAIAAYIKHKE